MRDIDSRHRIRGQDGEAGARWVSGHAARRLQHRQRAFQPAHVNRYKLAHGGPHWRAQTLALQKLEC
jgi:hypothetical protein